jgi:hypothetical protein
MYRNLEQNEVCFEVVIRYWYLKSKANNDKSPISKMVYSVFTRVQYVIFIVAPCILKIH